MKQTAANMNPNKPGKLVRPWKWRWSHLYSQSFPLMTTLYLQTGWADTIKLHKITLCTQRTNLMCSIRLHGFVLCCRKTAALQLEYQPFRNQRWCAKTKTLHPAFKKCLSMAQPRVYSILARCHVSRGISVTPNTCQSHLMNFGHIWITKHL